MAVLKERLNKTDMEKVDLKFRAMYQCILNVTPWNDWRKLAYSQVHGSAVSAVLKALSFQSF